MTPKENLKVRLVQMCSGDDPGKNITYVSSILEKSKGFDVLLFPENSLFFRIDSNKPAISHTLSEDFWMTWAEWAQKENCTILLVTPILEMGRVVNAVVKIDGGGPTIVYRKVHLFDVDVAGEKPNRESDYLKAGEGPAVIEIAGWKFGLSICYDVRFAELYLNYSRVPVDVIIVPAAFLVPTGKAHWEVLLRARAIENQCFVLAPGQSGTHSSGQHERKTFGHSLIIDPWGKILAEATKEGPELLDMDITRESVSQVRRQIPMAKHRRLSYNL